LFCKINQRTIPFGSPSAADSGASVTYSMFSGVTIAEEAGGVGDKVSANTTMVSVETLMEAFPSNYWTWDYFPQLPGIRTSEVSASGLMDFDCIQDVTGV
jgi:hypothetical protein